MFKQKLFLEIAFVIFLLILFNGCKKEENPTGPGSNDNPTQVGAGTMSCKIDGQSWSSTTVPGAPVPGAYAQYITQGSVTAIGIVGMKIDGTTTSLINIFIYNVNSTGEYKLGTTGVGGAVGYAVLSYQPGKSYTTTYNTNINGKIVITKFDTANKIISGTFEFKAKENEDATELKVITEGKFDVKWGLI